MLAPAIDVNPGVVGNARRRDDRATGTIGGSGEHHPRFYVNAWAVSGASGQHSKSGIGGYGVLDRAYCYRLVAWFPTSTTGGASRAETRAVAEAARLNLKHGPWPTPLTEGSSDANPTSGEASLPSLSGDQQEEGRVHVREDKQHAASNQRGG